MRHGSGRGSILDGHNDGIDFPWRGINAKGVAVCFDRRYKVPCQRGAARAGREQHAGHVRARVVSRVADGLVIGGIVWQRV